MDRQDKRLQKQLNTKSLKCHSLLRTQLKDLCEERGISHNGRNQNRRHLTVKLETYDKQKLKETFQCRMRQRLI